MTALQITLQDICQRIADVWGNNDRMDSWLGVVWLLRKQLDEITEANYTGPAVINESADILIILLRFLDRLGYDPAKVIIHRLNTRHKGKVKEIITKYAEKWQKDMDTHRVRCTDICPKCGGQCKRKMGHNGLHNDGNQHLWEGMENF